MPALSPTMTSGKIARWTVKEGDKLSAGQAIAEIETDKVRTRGGRARPCVIRRRRRPTHESSSSPFKQATMDFQFQDDDMYMAKILVPAGSDIAVGTPVALVVDDEKDLAEVMGGTYAAGAGAPAPKPAPAAAPAPSHAIVVSGAALGSSRIMPSARSLLSTTSLSGAAIVGTGKGGRVTKGDVLVAMGALPASALDFVAPASRPPAVIPTAAPASTSSASASSPSSRAGGSWSDVKPTTVRKVIASRLTESKATIPAQYATIDCRIDALLKLRAVLKDGGVLVSVNDLVIKAAAKALRAVPEANAQYDPKTDSVRGNSEVDVAVAVATEGGLITPIVKGADGLGVAGIAERVKDLAGRARSNKLKPEEFMGGSFTISNLGMFGSIDEFVAVINPPQACILAIGGGVKRLVYPAPGPAGEDFSFLHGYVPDAPAKGEVAKPAAAAPAPIVATVMTVQLSSDARVVEPAVAGQLLQVFRHYVEDPSLLLA